VFRGSHQVALGSADPDAEVWVGDSKYTGPITIDRDLTLRAYALGDGTRSPTISVAFRRLTHYPRITLSAPYAPQYAAAGDDTLIDGLRGGSNFRVGRWQGYQGHDLDATIDLGETRDIRHVAMGFLQDTGSWIFMPRQIAIEVSDDGTTFRGVGVVKNTVPEQESKPVTAELGAGVNARARYVRVRVQRYGRLPGWHPGAGNEAWFFADEISVR
jgi:hypothetical protein